MIRATSPQEIVASPRQRLDVLPSAPLSGTGGEPHGESGQVGGVDIGDQSTSLVALSPEDHVEPAIGSPVRADRADRSEPVRRPGHAASREDDERDRVQAPMKDEDRGLAIEEVADGAPGQWEVRVAEEGDDGSKVQ